MLKKKLRCRPVWVVALFTGALLCACSSPKSAVMSRTPDFCNMSENRTVPKVEKRTHIQPGKDTPVGGDYREKRR